MERLKVTFLTYWRDGGGHRGGHRGRGKRNGNGRWRRQFSPQAQSVQLWDLSTGRGKIILLCPPRAPMPIVALKCIQTASGIRTLSCSVGRCLRSSVYCHGQCVDMADNLNIMPIQFIYEKNGLNEMRYVRKGLLSYPYFHRCFWTEENIAYCCQRDHAG